MSSPTLQKPPADVLSQTEPVSDGDATGLDSDIVVDWDHREEASVRRKVDFILLPILGLAFFSLQVDRGNISAALTSTITTDLGITTNQINVGTQLLSAGIVLTEIPSNIILQRVGPQRWLSAQLFAWGLVATFQAFIKSYPAYLVTRLLLGLLEGGFIPGALYYISTWYRKSETSLRISLFFFGQIFAGATTSLISAGLLKIAGKGGLAGWQWIFLVEGLITIFAGIVFVLFLPPRVGDGRPLVSFGRWSYFNERESRIIKDRVIIDDPIKARGHIRITGKDILRTARNPRIIQHLFITLVSMSAVQGLTQYTPSMIKSLGFSAVRANALASVPIYCFMVLLILLSYLCDKFGHRGPAVLFGATWNLITYVCFRQTSRRSSRWHRYGVIVAADLFYAGVHVLNVGWLSVYCKTPQERSVAMALIVMAANCSGISGSQIFRTSDAPLYRHALTAICALAGAAWLQIVALCLQTWYSQVKKKKQYTEKTNEADVKIATSTPSPES
ncbi:allantoate permease, putative [Talaromyces stipitatus ATCC 10500]|uniref:Allantoate permease, putative n=1 Tax=Talaromyces stipitatus (strain ATCC 10500 / CBS 375.48 / QM 6759 / NRRL 1006) TaxID=441959 RepID=B8MIE8_TALSN|nr:allantoate permease, putative [Talaromyces stipitatus ATCC 10500]EED14632.1 allantoate permease, putative [Talaromyces stipitatus ATCC 10500]